LCGRLCGEKRGEQRRNGEAGVGEKTYIRRKRERPLLKVGDGKEKRGEWSEEARFTEGASDLPAGNGGVKGGTLASREEEKRHDNARMQSIRPLKPSTNFLFVVVAARLLLHVPTLLLLPKVPAPLLPSPSRVSRPPLPTLRSFQLPILSVPLSEAP
jgi:hypothetical protein